MDPSAQRAILKTQPLPKLQLGILYVAAFAIGLIPYSLILRSWLVGLMLPALVAMAFVAASWSQEQYAGEPPSSVEIGFAMLGRAAAGAVVGFFGLGTFYLFDWIVSLFGAQASTSYAWGLYTSLSVAGLLAGGMSSSDTRDTLHALYPDRPGQHSPYFPLSTEASGIRRLLISVAVIAALALFVLATVLYGPFVLSLVSAALLLNVAVAVAGADYLEVKPLDTSHGTPESAITVSKALLEAAGYRVIPRPRTGDREADSVISVLDFLAIRSNDVIAGRVKARTGSEDDDVRHEATALEPAVWVLEDQLRKQQSSKIRVKPVLIVLGDTSKVPSDTSASTPTSGKTATIVHAPSEQDLQAMIKATDPQRLQNTAVRLFGTSISLASSTS